MHMDRRSASPDRNREEQRDQPSSDVSSKKIAFEQHMNILGPNTYKSLDQKVRTNEASSSGSDGQNMRWEESDDKILRQADVYYAQGKYQDAEQHFRFFIDNSEQKPQLDDLKIALAPNDMAKVYQK